MLRGYSGSMFRIEPWRFQEIGALEIEVFLVTFKVNVFTPYDLSALPNLEISVTCSDTGQYLSDR